MVAMVVISPGRHYLPDGTANETQITTGEAEPQIAVTAGKAFQILAALHARLVWRLIAIRQLVESP